MRVIAAGAVVVGKREVRCVDSRRVCSDVRHAMRPPSAMCRARVELALQWSDESGEEIEEQPIRTHNDVTDVILHQGAENDGPHPLFLRSAVDSPDSLLCLVNARHKWQSDRSKFQAFE